MSAAKSLDRIDETAIATFVYIFIFALGFAAQHLIAYLRLAASASVGVFTPHRKRRSSKATMGQDLRPRDRYRQIWIEDIMNAPFEFGDYGDCEQMWIYWGGESSSLGTGNNLEHTDRKNLYKLFHFANSDVLKL